MNSANDLRDVGVLWSNPSATEETFIRATLIRPTFDRVLALALQYGLGRVQGEWRLLAEEGSEEARRAAVSNERILKHLEMGFARVKHVAS